MAGSPGTAAKLAASLAGPLAVIDPDLVVEPRRVVSRIYRDTRFARNKSPYKTTIWLTYKRPITDWQDAPAFFFEIAADSYRFGMGFYRASKWTMDRLRAEIETLLLILLGFPTHGPLARGD